MKVFSSITSPFAGRIAQILVGNGEDVEAGQPLFRLQ
jgi:biotin carboxyl carrier protein